MSRNWTDLTQAMNSSHYMPQVHVITERGILVVIQTEEYCTSALQFILALIGKERNHGTWLDQ